MIEFVINTHHDYYWY